VNPRPGGPSASADALVVPAGTIEVEVRNDGRRINGRLLVEISEACS
jgi:hypothetical protein